MKRKLKIRFVVGYAVMGFVLFAALLISSIESRAQDSTATTTDATTTVTTTTQSRHASRGMYDNSRPAAGIKGGLNASSLYTGDVTDKNTRFGFHAGIFGQVASSNVAALQLELNYSTRGTSAQRQGFIDQKTDFNLNYIDLPVLAVFKLGRVVELHAGGYAAYLVSANISSKGDLGNSFDRLDRDNFQSVDYGVLGGLAFNLGGVQIGGRYNLGLHDIAKSGYAKSAFGNAKNSLGQLYIAFNLNYRSPQQ